MANIYKITNDINDKFYIGQTSYSIEIRFKRHLTDAWKRGNEDRPLYKAIRKYGNEHFKIELIEKTDNPNEREKYWIQYYNSYENGYNATLGGEGKQTINKEQILQLHNKYHNASEVAREVNCSLSIVCDILKGENISPIKEYRPSNSKKIYQYDKKDNLLNIFWSSGNAADYIIENKLSKAKKHSVTNKIRECARGIYGRKSAFGFIWKYDS